LNKPTIGHKFSKDHTEENKDEDHEDETVVEKVQNNDLFNFSDKNENLDE